MQPGVHPLPVGLLRDSVTAPQPLQVGTGGVDRGDDIG
jgi:hypothetical protein